MPLFLTMKARNKVFFCIRFSPKEAQLRTSDLSSIFLILDYHKMATSGIINDIRQRTIIQFISTNRKLLRNLVLWRQDYLELEKSRAPLFLTIIIVQMERKKEGLTRERDRR